MHLDGFLRGLERYCDLTNYLQGFYLFFYVVGFFDVLFMFQMESIGSFETFEASFGWEGFFDCFLIFEGVGDFEVGWESLGRGNAGGVEVFFGQEGGRAVDTVERGKE